MATSLRIAHPPASRRRHTAPAKLELAQARKPTTRKVKRAPVAPVRDLTDLTQQLATLLASHPAAWSLTYGVGTAGDGMIFIDLQKGGPTGFVARCYIADDGGTRRTGAASEDVPLACPCHGARPGGAA